MRVIRNKIAHFHHEANLDEFISAASLGLDVFIEFYLKYILNDLDFDNNRVKGINESLCDVKNYVKVRLATLNEKYKYFDKPKTFYFNECNNCLQDAFIIKDDTTIECYYCGAKLNIQDTAKFYSNFDEKIKKCPMCKYGSMCAIHSSDNEEEAWDCIICGYYINKPNKWIKNPFDPDNISINSIKDVKD